MRKKRYHRPQEGERRRRTFSLVLAFACIAGSLFLLDSRMRPVIQNIAAYQARVFATKCVNDAMAAEMEKLKLEYTDIVKVTQNSAGEVTSIQTNMVEVNSLKTKVTDSVVQELQKKENQVMDIPIGTLMGVQITSGRGPLIEVKVIPTGYVQTNVYNQFLSAGINQTLHQIVLETSIQMIAIVPGYTVQTETVTNYCIAETVIVGSIPESYTRVEGDGRSTISKINDYS